WSRLAVGWALGVLVSVGGLGASWAWDLPTGATVVVAFGALLAALALGLAAGAIVRAARARGPAALSGVAAALLVAVGVAGLPLLGIGAGGALWLLRRRRAQAL